MKKLIEVSIEILSISTIRYFLLAGIPFVLFYILLPVKFGKYKIQQKLASQKDFRREIGYSMQSILVFTVIAVAIQVSPLKQYTLIYNDIAQYPVWFIAFGLIMSLIIHDTYFYWMHRLLHNKTIFKFTHLVHHKSTNPSPWTSYSFHFFEAVIEGLVLIPIVFMLPIHPITIFLFTILAFLINVYGHLGYEIAPKWFRHTWLFEVINTSVHHNMHHSKFKGNYGLYFRIWDRLMGTENPDYVKEYDKVKNQDS
ncbi:sterol desaturase family protein [Sphingobacterium sp.]|uniref:sterol desaturase family protein n=1 Tax=Sphingobacterium sp. TaxID=341027 RepID=UPI0031DDB182